MHSTVESIIKQPPKFFGFLFILWFVSQKRFKIYQSNALCKQQNFMSSGMILNMNQSFHRD
ncbi:MAG TPA: hypothetical protein DEF07_03300 [Nitrosomonas sp.]|nr:hypothetical protein [Nitrosomonas sp.]